MKPVMLYTLPRTRATVLFYGCRRAIVKGEVFSNTSFNLNDDSIKKAFYKIEDPNTVLKIHGAHISRSPIVQEWYSKSLNSKIYDIFVVERPDRLNTFLSLILAEKFGYIKAEEIDPFDFFVTENDIEKIKDEIAYYLRYYPTYGTIIDLKNYPPDYFDPFLMNTEDQESYKKYQYIKNFDWAVDQIQQILTSVETDWQQKINNLNTYI
jgi:hypothetical protein